MEFIIVALILVIVYKEYAHRKDIIALIDRLMAKNLTEYTAATGSPRKLEPKSMSDRVEYEKDCKRKGIIPEKEEK